MNEQVSLPQKPDSPVNDTRAVWRDIGKGMIKESISTIDETAKQIIGVTGILEGLYFHAIAFTDLNNKVTSSTLWIYLAPVGLLLISLTAALLVYFPKRSKINFNSSEACQLFYERTVSRKLLALRIASLFLVLGVIALFFAVMAYLKG